MRELLLEAKQGFRMADSTDSLFLMQLVAEDSRRMKNWKLAEFTAEQMLGFDPNYAGGHYEMGMVKIQTGQLDGARSELQKSVELWRNADPDLDELRQAKTQLAALR